MSGLRAEDVKKSLERWERSQRGLSRAMSFSDIEVVAAAAREWVAYQEQTPNYEAALGLNAWTRAHERTVRRIVDAALGIHPQDEGDER